jgi:hypothetical protein
MTPTNGHAHEPANSSATAVQQFAAPASDTNIPAALTPNAAKIKELIASGPGDSAKGPGAHASC